MFLCIICTDVVNVALCELMVGTITRMFSESGQPKAASCLGGTKPFSYAYGSLWLL
jgi:hypothetical protein